MKEKISQHINEVLGMHKSQAAHSTVSQPFPSKSAFNNHQAHFFDEHSDWYISTKAIPDEVKLILSRMFKIIADVLSNHTGDQQLSILDVGCGSGVLVPFIEKIFNNPSIHAIDLSQKQLNNLYNQFPHVKTHQGDISLFSSAQKFDLIICNACFGNFYSQVDALKNMDQLLVPNGIIAISHPLGAKFVEKLHTQDPNTVPHCLPTTENQINQLCENLAFKIQKFILEEPLYLLLLQKGS